MSLEYRVFQPSPTDLGCQDWNLERRRDVYIVLSPRLGLKKRGGGGWELKTRTNSGRLEGLDRWTKEAVVDLRVLEGRMEGDELEALQRWQEVEVKKARSRRWEQGVVVEQVELEVRMGEREEKWRTWSVEGEEDSVISWIEVGMVAAHEDGPTKCCI